MNGFEIFDSSALKRLRYEMIMLSRVDQVCAVVRLLEGEGTGGLREKLRRTLLYFGHHSCYYQSTYPLKQAKGEEGREEGQGRGCGVVRDIVLLLAVSCWLL